MPSSKKARGFMCAVCGGAAKPKKDQKLPSKAVACEQCTAGVKKSIREEIEREPPTKRFLMKFASNLSQHLPSAMVQDSMKRARGHAGGKITRILINKAAGILAKEKVNYRKANKEETHLGMFCNTCEFLVIQGDNTLCNLVAGDVKILDICDLWKGEGYFIKSQPDSGDVHVNGLLNNLTDGDEGDFIDLCKFESQDDDEDKD